MESDSIIWYGERKGLYKLDLKNLTSTKIKLDEPIFPPNYRNYILELELVKDTLYVGTANGLYLVNKNSHKIISKHFINGKDVKHRESSQSVQSIYPKLEKDVVWVALMNGFYRLDLRTNTHKKHTISSIWSDSLAHNFNRGYQHESNLMMPAYGLGMVAFNFKTEAFSRFETGIKYKDDWRYNIIRSAIPINDSTALVNVAKLGNAVFNNYTKTYKWLKTPDAMMDGVFLNLDRSGYVWASKRGQIFRSTIPLKTYIKPFKHIIDVSSFKANNTLVKRPNIDGYAPIQLNETERNIDIEFSISKPYVLDDFTYQYNLDESGWETITDPNDLKLYDVPVGHHNIVIRAISNTGNNLASRELSFYIYQPFYKSSYFLGLILLALLILTYFFGRYKKGRRIREEELKTSYELKLTKLEAEALRSQINPHFIFNTLNSIKYYTIKKDKHETLNFINEFSTLIRQILETSRKPLVSIDDELKTITSYIEIEKLRFSKTFNYHIDIDTSVDHHFQIPPMIIQPFIENAIWHGLMHKDGDRQLTIRIKQEVKTLILEIEDNGIGRKASNNISKKKSHKSSLGISITSNRLKQLEMLSNIKSSFEIFDLYSSNNLAIGTKVVIKFKKTTND
ncbi:histidine kinase [Pontimicrobium sp. SW4]|uniref:Histidine kinase n=1 Tax=Pontimicrobium sp. SW4 TaxID=3153519 RepID=A0AAU7BP51_9FLAO